MRKKLYLRERTVLQVASQGFLGRLKGAKSVLTSGSGPRVRTPQRGEELL